MMNIKNRAKHALAAVLLILLASTAEARTVTLDLVGVRTKKLLTAAASTASAADSGVVRQHRLAAGAAKVSGLAVGDEIVFALFTDKELTVTLVEETPSLTGHAFLGRIDNALNALGCVVLETDAGITLDVTDFENDRVWQVVSDDTGVTVREVQPMKNGQCGNDTETQTTNSLSMKATLRSSGTASAPQMALSTASSAASAKPTVDILINYDTEAAAWARTNGGGLTNFAETAVQKMNTALANTGLTSYFSFRLVGVYEVGKSADGNPTLALYLAQGRNVNYGGTTVSGWSDVATERDRVHADIVCTLCYRDTSGYSSVTTGIGNSLKEGSDSAGCGFNACLIQYVSSGHTMTHEVGHNMGAGHSDKMADSSNCGPQYYSYSSGYYFYVGTTGYYTIMAYNADGYGKYYTSVPYFSSPNYTYRGVAVGTSVNDNTQTLRLNYVMVANNRKAPFESAEIGQGFEAESYTWTTDGAYPWARVTDSSSDGVDSSRSCEMSGSTTSWAETQVVGPATLTFKLRLRTYGGWFNVLTDGKISYTYGNSSTAVYGYTWESVSVSISSGTHTVRLAYTHNSMGYTSGGNGAWVDQLSFVGGSPAGDDPIPELDNPTTAQIATVLKQATDSRLAAHITSGTEYEAFRTWSAKVKSASSGSAAGAAGVMAAPHAWLSYALGSATLLAAAPTEGDLTVEKFEPQSEKGKFDFTVGIKGVTVGDAASKENLKQIFGLTGGTSPNASAFSSANVDITFGTPSGGKVKFTAGPKDTSAKSFFMKVNMAE